MTNEEVKRIILEWCDEPSDIFSFPTDNCDYEHHIKFVDYRNKHWNGKGTFDFTEFVRNYAETVY